MQPAKIRWLPRSKARAEGKANNLDRLHQLNKGGEHANVKMEWTVKNHIIKQNRTKGFKKNKQSSLF